MRSSQPCPVHALVVALVNLDAQFHHLLANLFTPSDGAFLKEVPCLGPSIGMHHQNLLV
jgi:hypothetical protein